jgi:hypothetical protein
MALRACKECGKQISTKAAACPNCGAKPPQTTSCQSCGCLAGIILLSVIIIGNVTSRIASNQNPALLASNRESANVPAVTPSSTTETVAAKSAALLELGKLIKRYDEVEKTSFYFDPAVPMKGVGNYFGLYIVQGKEGPPRLRWKFMYTASDWLFIESMTISVDGEKLATIPIGPADIERDNGGEEIWEWCDESVSDEMLPAFAKIARGKKVIVRYQGRQYFKDRTLSEKEKSAMLKMIQVYSQLKRAG